MLFLVACCALAMDAHAATTCNLTITDVAFGSYDVFTKTKTKSTGKVKVKCTASASYTISLSAGSGTFASRVMTSGRYQLDYNLYTDSAHTIVWGDGTAGTSTVSATGTGATYTVYGLVPALQNVAVGDYSDTITVTVTY